MELLAPAGSIDALKAAVQSGADAVYIGGSRFSARTSCKNFDGDEIKEMIDYCHLRGVMVHIAANTLIKEDEVNSYLNYIGVLNESGADAIIIQDIGMAKMVRKMYPDLPIHASTQMTCASLNTAKRLEKAGFSRIVLARELDYEAIDNICKNVDAEIEVFVHGAICMSYSGQCLMSSMIGGRSGNRGMCAQPCRLPYKFFQNGKDVNNGYLLSPKDMCLVNHLEKLRKSGVKSLKIEGRLKRPEYVSAVVGVYRKCIDEARNATEEEYRELLNSFNRSGFCDGYFTGKTGICMMSYKNPSNISENIFTEEAKKRCGADIRKVPVNIEAEIKLYNPMMLKVSDNINTVTVCGTAICEAAQNKPLSIDRIKEQLSKLGNTPFVAENVIVDCDEEIIVPISEINSVRRQAIEELSKKRTAIKKRKNIACNPEVDNLIVEKELSAKVSDVEQAKACIKNGIERIYAPSEVVSKLNNDKLIQLMPSIERENNNNFKILSDKIMINSIGQFDKNKICCGNYRLNVFNSLSLDALKNLESVTLSPELTIKELKMINKPTNAEIIVYGKIPLMTFENCPVKANNKCMGDKAHNELTDRMNERFTLMCTEGCFCELLNSKPIYMADKLSDLEGLNVKYFRLDFTTETYEQCDKIIEEYKKALSGTRANTLKENTFTRGHFYKKTD